MFWALKHNAQARFFIEPYLHSKIKTANTVTSINNPLYSIKQRRVGGFESLYYWINIGGSIGFISQNNKNIYFISYRSDGSGQRVIINTSDVQLYGNKYYANNRYPYFGGGVIFKNLAFNYQYLLYNSINTNQKKSNKIYLFLYSGILFEPYVKKDEMFTDLEYNITLLNLDTLNIVAETRATGNKVSPIFGIGFNYAIHNKKREVFNIRLCYNHSFIPLSYHQINIVQSNTLTSTTQNIRMYGHGSGINLTVAKRINVLTLKKKDV